MTERRRLLQDSLLVIERLEGRLTASERAMHEPIAIIGAGCRYPGGVENLDDLWRLVRDGVDAVSEVPGDRWNADAYYDPNPKAPGKMVTKRGGFLRQVDRFDPQFFGISPREAATMDPQQRLLLETATEALESAGLATDRLVGSATGVFVGITTSDYGQLMRLGGPEHSDVYSATGAALNAAAGRLAFTFGFQGPCASLDTACSSSLVAVHLACQSLRTGESNLALAGGVNVILSPDAMILFSKWGMMAPDGACKTFDAAADGFVRAEGCAVIALKRLSDALADGDPILAVIRGSASNSDGKSSGLTVPNGPAQQAVLRTALASAELQPSDIDYVEAHGTGTSLGDPIEVEALGAVMAPGRSSDRPLLIGSIKTNIGHAEASSGIAGLLKVVAALRHEAIPPHLHYENPNPRIPWSDLPMAVPTTLTPWKRGERPRRAGVSSFGFSGTNAHVIVEEAPLRTPRAEAETAMIVPLSGRNDAAVREIAARYAEHLAKAPDTSLADIALTASTGRAHSLRRVAVIAESASELAQSLRSIAAGEIPPGVAENALRAIERPKVAFVFTGQGAQYAGMGRGLYESEPVFRAALDRCAAILAPRLERPLLEVIFATDGDAKLVSETAYTQPALFALEYALSELWASWGITPSLVMGHSVGEYVAACVAGVFSLEDGLALIAERGRLMQALPPGGGMAAVYADEASVRARLEKKSGRLTVAAVNAPDETVVAGDADALAELVAECTADGVKSRVLDVSHAFHSHRLDPMLDALERRAASVTHHAPRIGLVSNLTGALWAPGTKPDASYWRRHAREPVRFAAGIEALRAAGVSVLVEVGPHSTLLALAGRAAKDARWTSVASLRKGRPDRREMLSALATLYTRGASVRWEAAFESRGRRIALPTYPFQRERYWVEAHAPRRAPERKGTHPLLGERQRTPQSGASFLGEIGRDEPAFLADHVVLGTVLLPGTAYVELGLAAARALGHVSTAREIALESFVIEAPLALASRRLLHVEVSPSGADRSSFVVRSSAPDDLDAPWTVHAKGQLRVAPGPRASEGQAVAAARSRCTSAVDVAAYYTRLASMGLEYGEAFRLVRSLDVGKDEAIGVVELPPGVAAESWVLHPAILDAAFHLLGAALIAGASDGPEHVYLPVGIEEVRVCGAVPARVQGIARIREAAGDAATRVADVRLEDEAGNVVVVVTGLQIRKVTPETLRRALALGGIATHSYRVHWTPLRDVPADARLSGSIVLLGDRGGFADELARVLGERGAEATVVAAEREAAAFADVLRAKGAPSWVIDCAAVDPAAGSVSTGVRDDYLRVLAIVRTLASAAPRAGFCLLTRGAQAIMPGDDVDITRASLLGLARTVAAERGDAAPALRIDLDPTAPPDARAVVSALASAEPELGVRNGTVFVPRLGAPVTKAPVAEGEREVLRIRERGALDALRIERDVRKKPGAGEVEIAVRAAGLNFRDVLNALGMYPGDAGALGSECSGVVTAVGPNVGGLAVGDEVLGFALDSFASHAVAPASMLVRKPANVTFAEAVTLPNTYLTAARALRAGGLRAGQRVLVHAAAGGVGLAAVRLAKRAGAEVIATAGSAEKRAFVLAEGASHAFDSRAASFADDVMRVTNGEGVDLVLNSLSGELITAGMRVLKRDGAFLEIGKKDIWTPAEAAERAPHVRYHVIDLGQDMVSDVASVRVLFDEVLGDVAAGHLAPLPLRAFPLSDAVSAFRHMATARHIGKVVLVPESAPAASLSARADATYLVTGGLGGLGFATAEWLAKRGAGEVVLVSRSAPKADERIERLRQTGCKVTVVACDIGDEAAVRALFADVLRSRPPLRGIFHTAGVLADAPLAEQNAERFEAVARGKIDGAWNLSELSSQAPLDFFVLYSSSSALFGSPGQTNYAAANALLDGLAAHRRARGKVATSVGWGAWAEVGMAARLSDAHKKRWAQLGVGFLEPEDALAALEGALLRSDAHVAIAALDPSRVVSKSSSAVRALFGALTPSRSESAEAEAAAARETDSLTVLRSTEDAGERLTLLHRYVHREAARVLGFNSSALDAETPLATFGFDSLMAVQLKNRVESDLAIEIPLVRFLTSPTVVGLTSEIASRLDTGSTSDTSVNTGTWEEGSL